jgi:hypothetical protein
MLALTSILKMNKILLSVAFNYNSTNKYSNKLYYLSFSRTKNPKLGYIKTSQVVIEFDGRLLKTKYSGKSIDYWKVGKMTYVSPKNIADSDEYEDRIFSDSPYLENLDKYIKYINIIIYNGYNGNLSLNSIKETESVLLKKIRIFNNNKDFILSRNWQTIYDYIGHIIYNREMDKSIDIYFLKYTLGVLLIDKINKTKFEKEKIEELVGDYINKLQKYNDDDLNEIINSEEKYKEFLYFIYDKAKTFDEQDLRAYSNNISHLSNFHKKNEINYVILKFLSDEMLKYKATDIVDLIKAKRGESILVKYVDYSNIYSFAYKSYDVYKLIDNDKESNYFLNWTSLPQHIKQKIYNLGLPITNKNVINTIFNLYDEKTAYEKIKKILDSDYFLFDLRNKLVYKEIEEKDSHGGDMGYQIAWGWLDKDKWVDYVYINLINEKNFKYAKKLYNDDEVRLRLVWAITEKLIGEEKTIKYFNENNLILKLEKNKPIKYIFNK